MYKHAFAALSCVLSACSPAPGPAQASRGDAAPASDAPSSQTPSAGATTADAPSPGPEAREQAKPWNDSTPAGVEPLTSQEAAALANECKSFVETLKRSVRADAGRTRTGATDALIELLEAPPPVKGVDVPRCTSLMRRELVAYRAKTIETQAAQQLKMIAVGLQGALEKNGKLCPSAPPVPSDVNAVASAAYESKRDEWSAAGWKCVAFDPIGAPQSFQLELVTAAATGAYRIIARGFPVQGGAPVELFIEGTAKGTTIDLGAEVMRK